MKGIDYKEDYTKFGHQVIQSQDRTTEKNFNIKRLKTAYSFEVVDNSQLSVSTLPKWHTTSRGFSRTAERWHVYARNFDTKAYTVCSALPPSCVYYIALRCCGAQVEAHYPSHAGERKRFTTVTPEINISCTTAIVCDLLFKDCKCAIRPRAQNFSIEMNFKSTAAAAARCLYCRAN